MANQDTADGHATLGGKRSGGGAGSGGGLGKLIAAEFVASSTGAFACIVPGLLVGATPIALVDLTGVLTSTLVATHFEAVASVPGQFQQTSAFPGGNICVLGIFKNP